jgi:hypothetical protein
MIIVFRQFSILISKFINTGIYNYDSCQNSPHIISKLNMLTILLAIHFQ